MYVCMHIYIGIYVYIFMCMYICMYVCTCVCLYVLYVLYVPLPTSQACTFPPSLHPFTTHHIHMRYIHIYIQLNSNSIYIAPYVHIHNTHHFNNPQKYTISIVLIQVHHAPISLSTFFVWEKKGQLKKGISFAHPIISAQSTLTNIQVERKHHSKIHLD